MKPVYITAVVSAAIIASVLTFVIMIQPTHQNQPDAYYYVINDYHPNTNRTWGTDIVQNQIFHFADYNMSSTLPKPYWIDMYDTNFTFPDGLQISNTPGGAIFKVYVTFPNETTPYIISSDLGNSPDQKIVTILSLHQNPQAGYAIYNNTVRLLVNWPKIHPEIMINNFNETYKTGQPIDFQVHVKGFDYYNAGEQPSVQIEKPDGSLVWKSPGPYIVLCCPPELENYDRIINFTSLGGPITIDKVGLYNLVISYNDQTIKKQFSVIASHVTSIFDTGVYPFFVNVDNGNFTMNYNISGNNKLFDAKMDSQSKSLILSLKSTSNGTLVVSIPRALLDAKTNDGQDDQFIVLEDGREVDFKQINSTIMDRTLSIQFQNDTSTIEIIATQIV